MGTKNKQSFHQNNGYKKNGFHHQTKKQHFNNRGRGFYANNNYQNNNKSYQTQQNNSFNNGGYKSFRTGNHQSFRQNLIKSPYQRPNNQRRPKVRQLPSYQQQQNYLQNKRQNYQNMKNGNGNKQFKRFHNKNGQNNKKNLNFSFKQNKFDEAALDRELDSYHMKNPNVEDRKVAMNGNLDKELDDYWKSQKEDK